MAQPSRTTLVALTVAVFAAIAPTPAVAHVTALSCISSSVVKSELGVSVQTPPNSSISTNSFDGYKATVDDCTYSSLVNISYSTPATTGNWSKTESTLKRATAESAVSGIGNGAFSGTGSNTISTCKGTGTCTNKTVTEDNLWFFVTGKAIVEISAAGVTSAREEALARKIVAAL
jgi:hypothetical protein